MRSFRQWPLSIRIDIATACQLKCPSCPTASGEIKKTLGTRFMPVESFKTLVESHPGLKEVELSNWGEILLHPQLPEILRYAHERNLRLRADNGVNFNDIKPEALEALVKYRLYSMTCSIDGATPETYAIYRQGGNFDTVIENIKRLNALKEKYGSRYPILTWQFVVFSHNIHEVETARTMARSLNMLFYPKMSWDDLYTGRSFNPIQSLPRHVARMLNFGAANRAQYAEKYKRPFRQRSICSQLWQRPQINWDGRILGCCVNFWGDFGNAMPEGIPTALRNEKMAYGRKMLRGKVPARDDIPCTTCETYRAIRDKNSWLPVSYIFRSLIVSTIRNYSGIDMLYLRQRWLEIERRWKPAKNLC